MEIRRAIWKIGEITALNSIGKMLAYIMNYRTQEVREKKLKNEKAGFRRGKACISLLAQWEASWNKLEINSKLTLAYRSFPEHKTINETRL